MTYPFGEENAQPIKPLCGKQWRTSLQIETLFPWQHFEVKLLFRWDFCNNIVEKAQTFENNSECGTYRQTPNLELWLVQLFENAAAVPLDCSTTGHDS